jgi:hypothetical protein
MVALNIHDEERSGRPTIVTEELVAAKIDGKIHENRRFTITEFSRATTTCFQT